MFIPSEQGAGASNPSDVINSFPSEGGRARHLIFGEPIIVRASIRDLHRLGYAEANDWSRLLSTGRVNEVMSILTKHVTP